MQWNNHVVLRISYDTSSRLGLDPAFPSFSLENRKTRLDESDAAFVDVIHTNGGLLSFPWSIGHADFYVNGGALQPGCPSTDFRTLNTSDKCEHYNLFVSRKYSYQLLFT